MVVEDPRPHLDETLDRILREKLAIRLFDAPVELAIECIRRRRIKEVNLTIKCIEYIVEAR